MEEIRNEARATVNLIKAQTRNEYMKMLAINSKGMDTTDKAIIEEAKCEIRAKYFPKTSLVHVLF
jgi:Holliday junction resolvasome RuvABC ATP-dependent DNA helicase subunit